MPTFLFTATDPAGTRITDRIEQPTLSAAKYVLELRGLKNLVFHTDEMSAKTDAALQSEYAHQLEAVPELTPDEELEVRRSGGVISALWFAWKANSILWVPLLVWNLFSWSGPRPFGWGDFAGFFLSAIFLVYFCWMVFPSVAYQQLLQASVYYEWTRLRFWVRILRLLKKFTFIPIPDFELDFRAALPLAVDGQLDEAVRRTKKYENHPVGNFQYYSRLAGLYEFAGDFEKMTHYRRLAAEHGSGKPEEKLDIALGLLRRERKPLLAKQILDEIDLSDCGDLIAIFHQYCQGLYAVETANWSDAQAHLTKTLELAKPYESNVLMAGMGKDIKAYLSLALANLGQFDQAKQLFRQAEPLLKLRRENELIQRCRASLGITRPA